MSNMVDLLFFSNVRFYVLLVSEQTSVKAIYNKGYPYQNYFLAFIQKSAFGERSAIEGDNYSGWMFEFQCFQSVAPGGLEEDNQEPRQLSTSIECWIVVHHWERTSSDGLFAGLISRSRS